MELHPLEQPDRQASSNPNGTEAPPDNLSNVAHLLRIQASLHALLEELHSLRGPLDNATQERFVALDRELARELEGTVERPLREELQRLLGAILEASVGADGVRVVLAQLEGWIDGLLAGLTVTVGAEGQRAPSPSPEPPSPAP